MILQALKEYYDRKVADPNSDIAPEGFENKEITFVIVLDKEGKLVQIEDTRFQDGKKMRSKSFCVPKAEKRSSGIKANLLWDNAEYVLGVSVKGKEDRVLKQHEAFVDRIAGLGIKHDIGVNAVIKFLSNLTVDGLKQNHYFKEIKESNPLITFRLHDEVNLICKRKSVIDAVLSHSEEGNKGICLITGESSELARLQPPIKGVYNANTTGADIVSFNLSAFNSYGKKQGGNAPISVKSAFAYTTALNYLLRRGSSQKIQLGDATTVFWSKRPSSFEDQFQLFFEGPSKDNPDKWTDSVKGLLKSIESGVLPPEDNENHFFILGLSPNVARLSVRFWYEGTVKEFACHVAQYFRDLELVHAPYEKDHLPMWELLRSTAFRGKSENISPHLSGDWMRCILAGLPYPESLLHTVISRIKAECLVSYPRASILKAFLNRKVRSHNFIREKEITVSLDKENKNLGYRLGRLFATLEKIQEEAHPEGINRPIRDRYYSSASGTPATVMPTLMRLKNHHLSKLEKGKKIYFENLLGEIISEVNDFQAQLSLDNQGRFAIGYYHQRQAFFTKSEQST